MFALAGAAISLAFYRARRVAPTLALLTTAAVVSPVWYAPGRPAERSSRPFIGTFGLIDLFANISLWVTPPFWSVGMLHTGGAWRGMSRSWLVTKLGSRA